MGKYFRTLFISLSLAFIFITTDVDAAMFSSTSVRTAFFYENGTLSDSGFVSTNPRNLPQYGSLATGAVSMRLFQWRYSTSSALPLGRYQILTDITFSSLEGNNINNFLNPTVELGCGPSASNAPASNLSLVSTNFKKINDTKFQFSYTIDVLSSSCSMFSGIFYYDPREYDEKTLVNNSTSYNETLYYYTSYKEIEITNNQDVIDSIQSGTEDIINNNNQNTQDIIDSQDEIKQNQEDIKDSLTDETPPDTSGLGDAAGWLPAGPIDSIVTLPINLLQSLTNNLESSCSPINLPIPFVDSTLSLACPSTLLKKFDGFWLFWESFGLIAGVWVLYKYFINLYKWVESHLSMDEKESLGKWGGV